MQRLEELDGDEIMEDVFATSLLWLDWPRPYTAAHGRDWGGGFFTSTSSSSSFNMMDCISDIGAAIRCAGLGILPRLTPVSVRAALALEYIREE